MFLGKETLMDVNQNNGFLFALKVYTVMNNSLFLAVSHLFFFFFFQISDGPNLKLKNS